MFYERWTNDTGNINPSTVYWSVKNVLFVADVLNEVFGSPEAPSVFVGDLEAELLLDLPDDLYVIEVVEAEVLLEVGRELQLHTCEELAYELEMSTGPGWMRAGPGSGRIFLNRAGQKILIC